MVKAAALYWLSLGRMVPHGYSYGSLPPRKHFVMRWTSSSTSIQRATWIKSPRFLEILRESLHQAAQLRGSC